MIGRLTGKHRYTAADPGNARDMALYALLKVTESGYKSTAVLKDIRTVQEGSAAEDGSCGGRSGTAVQGGFGGRQGGSAAEDGPGGGRSGAAASDSCGGGNGGSTSQTGPGGGLGGSDAGRRYGLRGSGQDTGAAALSSADRAFTEYVVMGTLSRLFTIDAVISEFSRRGKARLRPLIRGILRISVFQLMYMDRVPHSAVCDEAVKLVKLHHMDGLSGFVNGLLRSVARDLESGSSRINALYDRDECVRYSLPGWIHGRIAVQYGSETAERIYLGWLAERPTPVRFNLSRVPACSLGTDTGEAADGFEPQSCEQGDGAAEYGTEAVEYGTGAVEKGTSAAEYGTMAVENVTGAVEYGTRAAENGTVAVENGTKAAEYGTVAVENVTGAVEYGTRAAENGTVAVENGAKAAEYRTGAVENEIRAAENGTGAVEYGTRAAEYGTVAAQNGIGAVEYGAGAAENAEAMIAQAIRDDGYDISRIDVEAILRENRADMPDGPLPVMYELKGGSITACTAFKKGWITVQDPASALVASYAAVRPGDTVIDVCAAPGGKSLAIADMTDDRARIYARDISVARTSLIDENRARCGFASINISVSDATAMDEESLYRADVLIADLPCSGLGVAAKKPDIKLNLKPYTIDELAAFQRDILVNVSSYVKPRGRLVYSTCTLTAEENRRNASFIMNELGFKPLKEAELLPGQHNDGFFIAVFEKRY